MNDPEASHSSEDTGVPFPDEFCAVWAMECVSDRTAQLKANELRGDMEVPVTVC
jgi:hypothetical protein